MATTGSTLGSTLQEELAPEAEGKELASLVTRERTGRPCVGRVPRRVRLRGRPAAGGPRARRRVRERRRPRLHRRVGWLPPPAAQRRQVVPLVLRRHPLRQRGSPPAGRPIVIDRSPSYKRCTAPPGARACLAKQRRELVRTPPGDHCANGQTLVVTVAEPAPLAPNGLYTYADVDQPALFPSAFPLFASRFAPYPGYFGPLASVSGQVSRLAARGRLDAEGSPHSD